MSNRMQKASQGLKREDVQKKSYVLSGKECAIFKVLDNLKIIPWMLCEQESYLSLEEFR